MCQPNFSPSQILCAIWIYYYYFFIPLLFLTAFFTHRSTWKIDDHSLGLRFIVAATAAGREKQQHGRRVAPSMPVFSFSLHYSWNCKAIFCANLRKRLNPEKRFIIFFFLKVFRAFCFPPAAVVFPVRYFAFIYWKSIFFSCVYVTETISEFLCTALSFTSRLLSLSLSP